jgi:hypothetical protein
MLRLLRRRKSEEERRDELLSAYLDGELGEGERQRLEARLAQDPTLRAELRALRQTVSLVQELPEVAAPRNFILSKSMVERRQPAPRPEPQVLRPSSERVRRAWAAPLLTAATAVVSLLFVVVLAGDLLLPGIGGLASAPQQLEQSKEIPQIALEAAPAGEGGEMEDEVAPSPTLAPMAPEAPREEPETAVEEKEDVRVEREVAPSPTPPPTPAVEAPLEEAEMAPEEEEEAIEEMQTEPAWPGAETPAAPMGGGAATEEAAALAAATPEPMVAPTVVSEAVLTPTIPAEAPMVSEAPAEGEVGLLGPTPSEIEAAPVPIQAEERGLERPVRGRLPWEVLEIGLGLTALVLTFATIQAWRVRRR